MNKFYTLCGKEENQKNVKLTAIYTFEGLNRRQTNKVEAGDIIAIAGLSNIKIGDTLTDLEIQSHCLVFQLMNQHVNDILRKR